MKKVLLLAVCLCLLLTACAITAFAIATAIETVPVAEAPAEELSAEEAPVYYDKTEIDLEHIERYQKVVLDDGSIKYILRPETVVPTPTEYQELRVTKEEYESLTDEQIIKLKELVQKERDIHCSLPYERAVILGKAPEVRPTLTVEEIEELVADCSDMYEAYARVCEKLLYSDKIYGSELVHEEFILDETKTLYFEYSFGLICYSDSTEDMPGALILKSFN